MPQIFPTRIVATKTTGGEVVKEFNVQSRSLRPVEGGIRQDYDPASGNINEVFVTNQTIKVDLYY